jgi:hypothetical protein
MFLLALFSGSPKRTSNHPVLGVVNETSKAEQPLSIYYFTKQPRNRIL